MATSQGKGWSSALYSETTAEVWQRAFEKMYRRASEAFLKVSGKKREDVLIMARQSQTGWELYKKLVKEIKKVDDLYSDESRVIFPKIWEADIENTIHMFSRNVAIALSELKISFKDEFVWLTRWWSSVI